MKALDPRTLPLSLKEAVVDGVLGTLTARLAGAGSYGHALYNAKPRTLLSTAFLLPQPPTERTRDEEASPIHISTHGLDFQVNADSDRSITVEPCACVYVRVYPTKYEVAPGAICRPQFSLLREIQKQMRQRAKDFESDAKKLLGKEFWKHPDWVAKRSAIQKQVHEEFGVPLNLVVENRQPAQESDVDVDAEDSAGGNGNDTEANAEQDSTTQTHERLVLDGSNLPDSMTDGAIPPMKWLRLEIQLPPLCFKPSTHRADVNVATVALNEAIRTRLEAWAQDKDAKSGGHVWGYRRARKIRPSDLRDWDKYLDEVRVSNLSPVLPDIKLNWDVLVHPEPGDPTCLSIRVALENKSDDPVGGGRYKESEEAVFQVSLKVNVPKAAHRPLALDRIEPSYRYNEYLHYPALGLNGGVSAQIDGNQTILTTTWWPRYVLPRLVPTDLTSQGVELRIAELAKDTCLQKIKPLIAAFQGWITATKSHPTNRGLDPRDKVQLEREAKKLETDLTKWQQELDAIKKGIEILEESRSAWSGPGPQKNPLGIPFEAWASMNEAMAAVAAKKGYDSWRLFQMAFILANIPAFATRLPEFAKHYTPEVAKYANSATLLYFPTGGGKSEAFLGLLLFTLFLDRLRGKERGVSAMLRYPLRLLTLQQAQRTAKALAQAELVRRRRNHQGEPFSQGFWVGSSNTPNWLGDEDLQAMVPKLSAQPLSAESELTSEGGKKSYNTALERWRKLATCPFCDSSAGIALRRLDTRDGLLGHFCLEPKCSWNESHKESTPLPFYIVDEDIYDIAPSVLLGTVDKLAVIGQSQGTIRKFFGMLGLAPWWEPITDRLHVPLKPKDWEGEPGGRYRALFPTYATGEKRFFDPFPSLLIQDEAHLLDESLGTFSALFETALDTALESLGALMGDMLSREPGSGARRQMKVIAASATVQEPERQMKTLYQRNDVVQFPYPGPEIYRSFYAQPLGPDASPADVERNAIPAEQIELRSHWARVYQSILTNGRNHTVMMVTTLANYHLCVTELYEHFRSNDAARLAKAQTILTQHLSPGVLTSAFERLLKTANAQQLLTLIDLHRIALTYVTNKKGGDQIIDAERTEFERLHEQAGYRGFVLDSDLITGAVDAAQIGAVVKRAEKRPKPNEDLPELNTTLRSIIATSAVSHGVDVEELNAMFFAGMPSDIAEYIQASSRIGRTHVGFSVLVPTPQRARDRYIVEVHDSFHRFLERMILPAAVDRWAEKALVRVVPSFFQTYVCGVNAIGQTAQAPDAEKPSVPTFSETRHIRTWKEPDAISVKRAVTRFIEDAYGIKPNFPTMGSEHYAALASHEVERILRDVDEPRLMGSRLGQFFINRNRAMRPMTSLRDVDEPGYIVASPLDAYGRGSLTEDAKNKSYEALERVMRFIRRGSGSDVDDSDEEYGND